ncbi:hypothetical protein CALCODRAFT_487424 [Calocera cornea HHB12733]|uniref:Uncharacterized protein n=1 Tax=Calocera cornea HHB12733 TaxID=1353952 RepID=A0A165D4C9_9BASI|nr:hypothetical protein CALCODRAFT_487424 [Calocera cornea HHB12733]
MSGLQPYNLSISSSSPAFRYAPFRDGYYGDSGEVKGGWRSSFKGAGGANSQWPTPSLNNWLDGVAYEETEFDGASVSLSFEGTALYFCIISAGEGDTYTMSINNTNTDFLRYAQPMASACGSDADAIMIAVAELPYGTHSVQLVAHPEPSADEFEDPDFYFYGGVVTLGMNGTYIQDVTIDDSDRSWTYFGNWTSETTNPYASDNTLHRSCYYGPENFVRYTFSNASVVRLLGQTSVDTGPYTVTLVGQTSNISASYNASNFWTTPQAVLFFAANLNPLEQYTISLINYDSQHPNTGTPLISNAGNNTCASIDALVLTQSHPSPPAPPPSSNISSSSTGAIIGGVVGALGILIMAFALWRYNKMRDARRTAQRRLAELDPALEDALEASRAEPTPFFLSTTFVAYAGPTC